MLLHVTLANGDTKTEYLRWNIFAARSRNFFPSLKLTICAADALPYEREIPATAGGKIRSKNEIKSYDPAEESQGIKNTVNEQQQQQRWNKI